MAERAPLLQLLDSALDRGGLQTDDVLAVIGPLLREVVTLHENGLVAALDGPYAYAVNEGGTLTLRRPQGTHPVSNRPELERLQVPVSSVLHLVGDVQLTNAAESGVEVRDLGVVQGDEARLERPAYLPGYVAWENRVGHHDPLSDILCLGQVLATLACGVDLTGPEDLRLFASQRENLFRINERLHPVMAAVIVEMTELDRPRRTQDLASVIRRLESYRDQPRRPTLDSALIGQDSAVRQAPRHTDAPARPPVRPVAPQPAAVLPAHELHGEPHRRERAAGARHQEHPPRPAVRLGRRLCAARCWSGEKLSLGRWLRFEDAALLPGVLDQIIQESRRDRAEFGFAQLRLVIAFLRWHNLKEAPRGAHRLAPAAAARRADAARRACATATCCRPRRREAEVNPVLRHHLQAALRHRTAGDDRPARRRRSTRFSRAAAGADRRQRARGGAAPADRPRIELIHERARQRLDQYPPRRSPRRGARRARAPSTYSYDRATITARSGLQLFHERVRAVAVAAARLAAARAPRRRPRIRRWRRRRSRPSARPSPCAKRDDGQPVRVGFRPVQR